MYAGRRRNMVRSHILVVEDNDAQEQRSGDEGEGRKEREEEAAWWTNANRWSDLEDDSASYGVDVTTTEEEE